MTREEFRQWANDNIIILDGATGSNLIKAGMPVGVCPEQWCINNPDVIMELQKEYVKSGTNILYAPTFSGNAIKLKEYKLDNQIEFINRELVKMSKESAAGKAYVAVDITMTGHQLYPVGDLQFEELVDVYKEQISYAIMEGADLIVVETMMSLGECRAALIAAREVCDLPVMVSLTFDKDGRTLFGTDPKTAVVVLQSMGVDAIGANCSTGPDMMVHIIKEMCEYAQIPVIAKPNAGLPKLLDGVTIYDMGPQEFADDMMMLIENGATIVGGCCGTTPQHIKALCDKIKEKGEKNLLEAANGAKEHKSKRMLSTERNITPIDIDGRFMIIGERINPTGKKVLQAQLKEGCLDLVNEMAQNQVESGADILDINVGMNGIDETKTMIDVVYEVISVTDVPLCIDSSYPEVIEAALRIYPGRALINSISLEEKKIKNLLPVAKKYGAMFILLPVSEAGMPKDMDERKRFIDEIIKEAAKYGLCKDDIIVDGLVNTIGAKKDAAIETLQTIGYCKNELGIATVCGLSNISFGMPQRQFVNSAFMAFAIKEGLTMAIANPSQDLLVNTAYASDLLKNIEDADIRYINRVNEHPVTIVSGEGVVVKKEEKTSDNEKKQPDGKKAQDVVQVFEDVVKGNKRHIVDAVKDEMNKGTPAGRIVDSMLIPAINHVGDLFDKQIYFLPQLIASAQTMKMGIDYLEPYLLSDDEDGEKVTIIMATVEGDVHDIGKNLVVLMLKNYGYNVIDLGKDVPAQTIVDAARDNNAAIIGLSALMTTTMMEMKKVVELVKEQIPGTMVIIGGAVTTQSFADEIHADGYSADAKEACELVKKLLEKYNKEDGYNE